MVTNCDAETRRIYGLSMLDDPSGDNQSRRVVVFTRRVYSSRIVFRAFVDGSDEAVAATMERLDEASFFRIIAERVSSLRDCFFQDAVCSEDVGPYCFKEFVLSDHAPGVLCQIAQNSNGLRLKRHDSVFAIEQVNIRWYVKGRKADYLL